MKNAIERCALCGCSVHRLGGYATPTLQGRSHATRHHFVAERFFGRSKNRPGEVRDAIFGSCPWNVDGASAVYCYECHEELLHNPVFTWADIELFAALIAQRGLNEDEKTDSREKLAGRIRLLQEVIHAGLQAVNKRHASFAKER